MDWHGVVRSGTLPAADEDDIHKMIDAAEAGRWEEVAPPPDKRPQRAPINAWRPGDETWMTPLHIAAAAGAAIEVIDALLRLGAWRTLPDAHGFEPLDHAEMAGADHLIDALTPAHPLDLSHSESEMAAMNARLEAIVHKTVATVGGPEMRTPEIGVMTEFACPMWMGIPEMYGGLSMKLEDDGLYVDRWSRLWPQLHTAFIITPDGQAREVCPMPS